MTGGELTTNEEDKDVQESLLFVWQLRGLGQEHTSDLGNGGQGGGEGVRKHQQQKASRKEMHFFWRYAAVIRAPCQ